MYRVTHKHFQIYSIAALLSILFSGWAALKTFIINPDAVCYLYSAAAMSKSLTAAMQLCSQAKWPFYSLLIFGVSHLTHCSYLVSAYLLDGLFSVISVVTFIAIVSRLTLRTRIVALAAIVILLAHEFNSLRAEIVRDHGFWAFYLLSLFCLLRYFDARNVTQNHKTLYQWCYAILWSISLVIATLFRIEGVIFLSVLPLLAFFENRVSLSARLIHFLQLNFITLIGFILLAGWLMIHPQQYLGRLPEIEFQLSHGALQMVHAYQQLVQSLAIHVVSVYAAHDVKSIALVMLLGWYVIAVITNVSLVYAGLIVYAWWKKIVHFPPQANRVIWTYIAINVLITFIFLIDNLFLAKRYVIALSLVLMLWVPFALDELIRQYHVRRWPLLLVILLMSVYGLGSLFDFGHSKKYIRDAGDWLALNAPAQSKIYSNNYQILYYSQHVGDAIFKVGPALANVDQLAKGKWRQYDYLALWLTKNEITQKQSLLHEFHSSPVVVFENDRGDQVRIYHGELR